MMDTPLTQDFGRTVSADIAVPEHEREVRFYSRVLGTGAKPLWREDLSNSRGQPIIGLGPMAAEYEHLPLHWMPHFQVVDVAASVERALELGGKELLHGKDADGNSLWAGITDPNGAGFGLIPVVPKETDAADDAQTGTIAWLDLTVPNATEIRDFYCQVIGWSAEDVAMTDGDEPYADYNLLGGDGNPAAGICHARGVNEGLPPVWLLYLPVGDLAESLARVKEEGGTVLKETRRADGELSSAVIQDPVGARIALASA